MQVFEGAVAPNVGRAARSVVTIGNFDGLHLGHRSLLKEAAGHEGPKVVLTFDPHPSQVLFPEKAHKLLLPRKDLAEQLPKFGVDVLWVMPFTREFASLTAAQFLDTCLGSPFNPRHVVAGYDFAFGKDRLGSLEVLKRWTEEHGAESHVVPPLKVDGLTVSSRSLRELVAKGDVAEALRFMGRPFYLRGEVIRGDGRGQQIGYPTLNQKVINETLPAQGVYASRVRAGQNLWPSVTNIGINPTFGGQHLKVETYVIDAHVDLRGQTIDVELWSRLRAEMKFSGIDSLKTQIETDILQARTVHRETMDVALNKI